MKFKYVQDSGDENDTDDLVTFSEMLHALQDFINIDELKLCNKEGK